MSMDNTDFTGNSARTSDDNAVTDAPLMAATPIWETRGKKRRGMGRAAPPAAAASTAAATAEPRSFEPIGETPVETRLHGAHTPASRLDETRPTAEPIRTHEPSLASSATVTDPMTGRPDMTTRADDDAGLVAPIGRTRTAAPARRSGAPMAAIAAGVVALGAVGAAGWYATRGDDGVAELTPGAENVAIAQAPAAPMAPMTGGADPAATTAATPAAATAPMAAAAAPARTSPAPIRTASRARPASLAATGAASASEQGIDASGTATLPSGPQAYSTLNGATDTPAATGASGVTTAPATETPAPMPSTPPIVSATPSPTPEATTVEPAAPTTVTPPQ